MNTTALPTACILAGSLAAACGSSEEEPSALESVIRDSAGVTIVENERPAPDTRLGWRIAEAPTVSIGAFEGDAAYELFEVRDATRLPDGRIVVANAGSGELRAFDGSGIHLATWGGRGEGPGEFGEFAAPWSVGSWSGDSIAASDMYARRVSIFDADGVHGRTFLLEDHPYYRLHGVLSGGRMFLGTVPRFTAGTMGTGMVRREVEYAIAAPDGSLHAALGKYPASEWYIFADRGMAVYPQPFRHSAVASVWGDLIIIGSNDLYEIRAYTPEGTVAKIVRREHEVRSPSQADVDAYLAEQYADETEQERAETIAELADMPLLEAFPAFGRVMTDSRDYLWVEEYQLPGEPAPAWTVFDDAGRVLGLMELPADVRLFEIGEDYILGSVSDDLGIERVQLWPLARSES